MNVIVVLKSGWQLQDHGVCVGSMSEGHVVEHAVRIRASEVGTPACGWAYFTYPARYFRSTSAQWFAIVFSTAQTPGLESRREYGNHRRYAKRTGQWILP